MWIYVFSLFRVLSTDLMQGKLFQRCTHLCSVLSLGGNVKTRRMSKPDMGSIFHINNQWHILVNRNYYVNFQNYHNSMLLTSSDTKRTLRNLFLFTNSAQKELVSICIQYTTAINFLCIITLVVALFLAPSLFLSFNRLNKQTDRFNIFPKFAFTLLKKLWLWETKISYIEKNKNVLNFFIKLDKFDFS